MVERTIQGTQQVHIQDALRAGRTLEELADAYSLHLRFHAEHPHLVSIKYDQLKSPKSDPLVQQCRGLIIDLKDNFRIISRGFDRFFNFGEAEAAEIDWRSATVYPKLDGSLIKLYWYAGKWQCATSGTPDGLAQVEGVPTTFRDLFWKVWELKGWDTPGQGYRRHTLIFELTTMFNQVVVRHSEPDIHLIGMRHNETGWEWPVERLHYWNPIKPLEQLTQIEHVIAAADIIDPKKEEGYVVVDDRFRRIKIKSPAYVKLHHLRGEGLNPRRMVEIVRNGEIDEILSHFPEWTEPLNEVKTNLEILIGAIEAAYREHGDLTDQKDFAIAIRNLCFNGILFGIRAGHYQTALEGVRSLHIDTLMKMLGMKTVPAAAAAVQSLETC